MRTLFGILLFSVTSLQAQSSVSERNNLPSDINETSGLIFYNEMLITHNDSGNQARLFEIDTISNNISRTVLITNATNTDWEDITQDATHIYIGDIGNNSGSRTDLKIYKIAKADYDASNEVAAEIINYSYPDQTDFSSNPNNNDWDAEALFVFNEWLVVCTKEWVSEKTNAYAIPKNAGTYSGNKLGSLDVNGLVTGADYDPDIDVLYLLGYSSSLTPFLYRIEGIPDNDVFGGTGTKTTLGNLFPTQAEGITRVGGGRYFFSSEKISNIITVASKLFTFKEDKTLSIDQADFVNFKTKVYPNPASHTLHFRYPENIELNRVEIYDMQGRLIKVASDEEILNNLLAISHLSPASYLVRFITQTSALVKTIVVR